MKQKIATLKPNIIRVSEIFESIQGEGKHSGNPMLFIRVSGCTRACPWCDTKYHWQGKEMSLNEIKKKIEKSLFKIVCWTGGEPLLYKEQIYTIIKEGPSNLFHHIETNGDLLTEKDLRRVPGFYYFGISPKDEVTAKRVQEILRGVNPYKFDIKIVTDLEEVGVDLIPYATMLMPLTTYDAKKDLKIKQKVWQYCIKHNLKYSARFQVDIWGKKKGI